MTKLANVLNRVHTVTPECIGRCHKVFIGSQAAYMVASESDPTKEYRVEYSAERGFTCQCDAGLEGFVHCQYGFCKHVLWSVAAAQEEKAAMKEQAMLQAAQAAPVLLVNGQAADEATVKRVFSSKGAKVQRGASLPTSKAFSILKK